MKARMFALGAVSAIALMGSAVPGLADGEEAAKSSWSGNVTLTSDYRFRGVSQTDNNTALQGGLQYNGSQGIYVGAWASNVDFAADVSTELDLFVGYTHALSENTSLTGQFIYYWYLNANDASETNYWELSAKLEHQMDKVGLSLEVAYAPDQSSNLYSNGLAITGGIEAAVIDSLPLFSDGMSVSGHIGRQMFDDNALVGLPDYTFYDAGVTFAAGAFALDVRYISTDMDEAECYGGLTWCESSVVVSGSLSFGD